MSFSFDAVAGRLAHGLLENISPPRRNHRPPSRASPDFESTIKRQFIDPM
jgi:hypothetical protein